MVFSTFAKLWDHHQYQISENFFIPPKTPYLLVVIPYSLLPQLLATTGLSSVYKDFSILDMSCKWNHTIYGLLCLASFTYHNVFKVYPCCNMYQYFIPFYGWKIFHFMAITQFVHLLADGHLDWFHFLTIMNNAVMNIHVQIFCGQMWWILLKSKNFSKI